MARRKKQAIPVVTAPYALAPQRELADTVLEDANTLLARHDVGVTDDTIDIWQTLRDLAGVVGDMSVLQGQIAELQADVEAADGLTKEAKERATLVATDADRRCHEATGEMLRMRAERDALNTEIEQLRHKSSNQDAQIRMGIAANAELQSKIDTLTSRLATQQSEPSAEQTIMSNIRRRYATYSARGPSGMSPTAIARDRATAERENA